MTFHEVAHISEIQQEKPKIVPANEEGVALFHVNGNIFAISNTCMHRRGPLGEGQIEGDVVTCPWHGW